MAGAMRTSGVYLGLTEDEVDVYDDEAYDDDVHDVRDSRDLRDARDVREVGPQ